MLASIKEIDSKRMVTVAMPDSNYDFAWWLAEVEKMVEQNTNKNDRVGIIGHKKDDTSYYLDYFPKWEFVEILELYNGLSATQIRERLFENSYVWQEPYDVSKWLNNWVLTNKNIYDALKDEYNYVKNYKNMWRLAPFDPVFVTTDAIVICKNNILLVRRGSNFGKGLYAMPGGFLEQTESIASGALRELKEETKIDVDANILKKSLSFVKVFDNPFRDQRGRSVTHVHLFYLKLDNLPNIKPSSDACQAKWVLLENLDKLQDKFFCDHYQIIKNMLKNATKL
jgi:bifunctional NMN adenylyltransferase/nudix hydrolase